jgi:branched-chain amino acid transport system substrate-binding protein
VQPDVVFAMETGADAARLFQQYASFGLKGQIPLLGAQNAADQSVIRTLGPECEGIVTSAHFAEGADIPATQAFVKAYSGKFNKIPSLYAFSHYVGAMWVAKAIGTIKGKVEDRDLFIETVLKTDLLESPLGKAVHFDDYGNPVYDVFIRKVVKKDGKYMNVPIETYPQVSQFWKYDPVTYMKQPSYSRDFQGIKKS